MIDTCIGADREREFPVFTHMRTTFLQDLASLGIEPTDVDTVLCTHLHFDHVGWNTHLVDGRWVPTFPQARYLFSRKEYDHWQMLRDDGRLPRRSTICTTPSIRSWKPGWSISSPATTDQRRDPAAPDAGAHARSRQRATSAREGEQAVITGDLMHHPIQLAMPAHPATFDMDKADGRARPASLSSSASRQQPVLVIGSHFADPGAGLHRAPRRCLEICAPELRRAMGQAIPDYEVDLFSRESVRNARAVDDALREFAPVVRLADGTVMIARHADVAAGLQDWKTFSSSSRPGTIRSRCGRKFC